MYECWQCHDNLDNAEALLHHLSTAHKHVDDDLWLYAGTAPTT
jgi:hypothetical protein